MRLYRTTLGPYVEQDGRAYRVTGHSWEELVTSEDLHGLLANVVERGEPADFGSARILAPVESQDVWAAGVTYYRSRSARMEESKDAGGGSFYDRVYAAERPELFFKSPARDVVGHLGAVRIRRDAKWSVPEPELTLLIIRREPLLVTPSATI